MISLAVSTSICLYKTLAETLTIIFPDIRCFLSFSVTPFQSLKPHLRKLAPDYHDDEDRLERLFDRSHQLETEERSVATATGRETEDSLHSKMVALSRGEREEEREEEREGEMEEEEERSEGTSCVSFHHQFSLQYQSLIKCIGTYKG